MLNGIFLLKRPYVSLIIATRGSKCENNLKEVDHGPRLFQLLTFTFDPFSMSSGVILLQRPYISFSSPLLLGELKAGENSIRDARTPQPGEIVFNTMRYRSSETVHRLGYFQSSVSVQIMFK